jgi:hypothetical protein
VGKQIACAMVTDCSLSTAATAGLCDMIGGLRSAKPAAITIEARSWQRPRKQCRSRRQRLAKERARPQWRPEGTGLEPLYCERREEGKYRSRSGGGNKAIAYSRCIIVKVRMSHQVGFMGSEHNMLVMHLHNRLANNKWPTRLIEFLDWLHTKTQEYDVKVFMGDFNMALFRVIPELRSRGVTIDLAAWYPWKSAEGVQMADSCGIINYSSSIRQASTHSSRA